MEPDQQKTLPILASHLKGPHEPTRRGRDGQSAADYSKEIVVINKNIICNYVFLILSNIYGLVASALPPYSLIRLLASRRLGILLLLI